MKRIYVDHAATTPILPAVHNEMETYMETQFGNPSSMHHFGQAARAVVENARRQIAAYLQADPSEITFTGSGTEADNLAILGTVFAKQAKTGRFNGHIITTEIEHHAVLRACQYAEQLGVDVTYLPVNQAGFVQVEDVQKALRNDTLLVSIMYANNETGICQPIEQIGALLADHDALFHTDAVQAIGVADVSFADSNVDMLSLAAHKINGPKGIGVLVIRRNVNIHSLIHGGAQEWKRRAGTENVVGIIGLAKAMEEADKERSKRNAHYRFLIDTLIDTLKKRNIDFYVNGDRDRAVPHIVNISFPGVPAEQMLMNLDLAGIAASSGSACSAGTMHPSHVIQAMEEEPDRAESAIRFSVGYGNTEAEMQVISKEVERIVRRVRR